MIDPSSLENQLTKENLKVINISKEGGDVYGIYKDLTAKSINKSMDTGIVSIELKEKTELEEWQMEMQERIATTEGAVQEMILGEGGEA